MDISQVEVRIPSITDLNQHISDTIKKEVRKQMEAFLRKVAQGEDLSFDKLKDKYMSSVAGSGAGVPGSGEAELSATTSKKKISEDEMCRARVSTGKRCSRRCRLPDIYCGGHLNARPYGEVNKIDE